MVVNGELMLEIWWKMVTNGELTVTVGYLMVKIGWEMVNMRWICD